MCITAPRVSWAVLPACPSSVIIPRCLHPQAGRPPPATRHVTLQQSSPGALQSGHSQGEPAPHASSARASARISLLLSRCSQPARCQIIKRGGLPKCAVQSSTGHWEPRQARRHNALFYPPLGVSDSDSRGVFRVILFPPGSRGATQKTFSRGSNLPLRPAPCCRPATLLSRPPARVSHFCHRRWHRHRGTERFLKHCLTPPAMGRPPRQLPLSHLWGEATADPA